MAPQPPSPALNPQQPRGLCPQNHLCVALGHEALELSQHLLHERGAASQEPGLTTEHAGCPPCGKPKEKDWKNIIRQIETLYYSTLLHWFISARMRVARPRMLRQEALRLLRVQLQQPSNGINLANNFLHALLVRPRLHIRITTTFERLTGVPSHIQLWTVWIICKQGPAVARLD